MKIDMDIREATHYTMVGFPTAQNNDLNPLIQTAILF